MLTLLRQTAVFAKSELRLAGGLVSLALILSACTSTPSLPPDLIPRPSSPITKPPAAANVLGLALGGGAARGFAHVGVLQVLEEAGIRPQLVVGTSAGSVVAALYAGGKSAKEIEKLSQGMDESVIADWGIPFFSRGAVRGEALATYVNKQLDNQNIEKLPLSLGIVATDLQSGEGILFTRGNTGQAVRASSSVPAIFQPVKIGNREYVDGGLVAPVPVEYAKRMGANMIVAVDISSKPETEAVDGMFSILMQTFNIMGKSINRLELKGADVIVRPNLTGIKSTDFNSKLKSMEAGREAMRQALPQLRALLGK